jgi:hypothetical protein
LGSGRLERGGSRQSLLYSGIFLCHYPLFTAFKKSAGIIAHMFRAVATVTSLAAHIVLLEGWVAAWWHLFTQGHHPSDLCESADHPVPVQIICSLLITLPKLKKKSHDAFSAERNRIIILFSHLSPFHDWSTSVSSIDLTYLIYQRFKTVDFDLSQVAVSIFCNITYKQ